MPYLAERLRASLPCVAAVLVCSSAVAAAQTPERSDDLRLTPTAALGVSYLAADLEDPARSAGAAVRAGVRLPYVDVTALVEHWRSVGDFRITSAHLEASYFLAGQRTLAPVVVLGIGYARDSYRGEPPPNVTVIESAGLSAAYGVGLQLRTPWRSLGVRTEGLLRTDAGGYNGEVRVLLGWTPDAPELPTGLPDASTDVGVYWMAPIAGPWRFVEPGYVVRFERPFHDELSGALAMGVFHWQIPGQAFLRDYIVDTRAFAAMPGVEWHPAAERTLSVRVGPSFIMMGEGPEDGLSLGTHLEAAISRPWNLPVSAGAGWLWMERDNRIGTRVSDADQHGLMLFGGFHF